MPVSHAADDALTSRFDPFLGLLEVLARVTGPRRRRGRRYRLVFVLAVAVACVLAGAGNFRELGDQAADLPQALLARLGGRQHPLTRRIAVPSEKRLRTMLQQIDADELDKLPGDWLRALAEAGRLEDLMTVIAIDGKWLRGIGDGQQVKMAAAMLHEEKVVIGQRQIPADTNEITQVRPLLGQISLDGAVVTADALHAQADAARYIAGPPDAEEEEEEGRGADYFFFIKGNMPGLQRTIWHAIQRDCPRDPDHAEDDRSHGRHMRRAIWAAPAPEDLGFPHAAQVARIRRDGYDPATGEHLTKEIVHAVTSLGAARATPAQLAAIARGQRGIESVHWIRDTAYREDSDTGYTGGGPQVMATLRNTAVSLLHIAGVTEITRTLQAIARNPIRMFDYLPL
jgi:predicted transposase YbfD/YdcC